MDVPEAGTNGFKSAKRDVFRIHDHKVSDAPAIIVHTPTQSPGVIGTAHPAFSVCAPVLFPPIRPLPIYNASAGHFYIGLSVDIKDTHIPVHFYTGDPCGHDGILGFLRGAQKFCAFLQVKLHVTAQKKRADQIGTGGKYNGSLCGGIYGFLDGFGVQVYTVPCGAVITGIKMFHIRYFLFFLFG